MRDYVKLGLDQKIFILKEEKVRRLLTKLESSRVHVLEVGKKEMIDNKESFFMALKKDIPLDDLLSYSWDALDECLHLDDHSRDTVIILYNVFEYFLSTPDEYNLFMDIFKDKADYIEKKYNKSFRLIIVKDAE